MSDENAKETDLQERCRKMVQNEVSACVSGIVADLAKGYGSKLPDGLAELAEEAFELCTPKTDWEEAALQEGITIRHDINGFYALTRDEAEHEDAGNGSAGFDGREHFETIEDAARAWCEANNVDAYEWEIYEHWIVSKWLAEKLEAKGERVGQLGDLTVWGRPTTGQAILLDSVIREIVDDMYRKEG